MPEFCPGPVCGGADFIYYDPWRWCLISETEGVCLADAPRRSISDGHPVGWSVGTIPDGWDANAQAVDNNGEVWDDYIPAKGVNGDRGGTGPSNVGRDGNQVVGYGRVASIIHEDDNIECPRCKPASECVRRFLTQVGFIEDKFCESWNEICGYVRALLRFTPSNTGAGQSNVERRT